MEVVGLHLNNCEGIDHDNIEDSVDGNVVLSIVLTTMIQYSGRLPSDGNINPQKGGVSKANSPFIPSELKEIKPKFMNEEPEVSEVGAALHCDDNSLQHRIDHFLEVKKTMSIFLNLIPKILKMERERVPLKVKWKVSKISYFYLFSCFSFVEVNLNQELSDLLW